MSETIERVLVALDATADSRSVIDTAMRLAAGVKAPLHAVFVEDGDLLSLAGLAVARQVIPGTGAGPLTTDEVELHLRAAASRAREAILVAARTLALECSFEIVRGAAEAALSSASARDLVVAGALARPVAGHFRVESRWLAALDLMPGPFLLACEGPKASSGVVALLPEQSAASGRLLQAAARIAQFSGGSLTLICPPALAKAEDFTKWVGAQIEPSTIRPRIEAASPGEPAALQARIAELGCGLLAIGAGTAESGVARLREWTGQLDCDVLIVR